MRSDVIIDVMMAKVKSNLQNHADLLNAELTAGNAQAVTLCIMAAVMEAAVAGFKTYIQENEIRENTIDHAGQKYQFNRTSSKEYSTIFGKSVFERRLYQNEAGESFVPLDHAWNMENQFATIEVREAVLFALSLMPACEARQVFDKCATFQLAESSFKKIAENMESYLEDNIDDLLETIRSEEVMPVEEVKVIAVSEDGANVLLHQGIRFRRGNRHPQRGGHESFV